MSETADEWMKEKRGSGVENKASIESCRKEEEEEKGREKRGRKDGIPGEDGVEKTHRGQTLKVYRGMILTFSFLLPFREFGIKSCFVFIAAWQAALQTRPKDAMVCRLTRTQVSECAPKSPLEQDRCGMTFGAVQTIEQEEWT